MTQARLPWLVNSRATSSTTAGSMPASAAYSSSVRSPTRSLNSSNTLFTRDGLPLISISASTRRSAAPSTASAATSWPSTNTNRASSAMGSPSAPASPARPSTFAVTMGRFGRSTATRCVASDHVGSPSAAAAFLPGAAR